MITLLFRPTWPIDNNIKSLMAAMGIAKVTLVSLNLAKDAMVCS